MKPKNTRALNEIYEGFVFTKKVQGCSEATLRNYADRLHNISKFLDIEMPLCNLTKRHLEEMIYQMREAGLAHNSIAYYVRSFRTFLLWCNKEGLTDVIIPQFKERDTVKETYSDEELELLLKKPKANCEFCEYRCWVIVNFLMNCGYRTRSVVFHNRTNNPRVPNYGINKMFDHDIIDVDFQDCLMEECTIYNEKKNLKPPQ